MSDLEFRLCVAAVLLAFAVAGGTIGHLDWEYKRWRRVRRMSRRGGWVQMPFNLIFAVIAAIYVVTVVHSR